MANEPQAPKRTGLLEFLRSSPGCQFVIPVYQRNYTWTAGRDVKQYLEDLNNILNGKYEKHFLGIMIYLDKIIDFSARELSVIDGQQRLTTTFLTLYALRELLLKKGTEDAINSLDGQYLTNPFSPNKIKYKLKPLVSDDEVYQSIVLNELDKIENKTSNVYKNYLFIRDFINKRLIEGKSVNDILMAMDKLYIVCIPISTDDNAQKIFESINATGDKLKASDLIRNFVLMDLPSSKQEKCYNRYWKNLETLLTNDATKLEAFFRLFLAAKNKGLPNKNAVYTEFVEWFRENSSEVEEILKDVVDYADSYHILYKKDISKLNKDIKSGIAEFRKISSDLPAPLLMELFRIYKKEEESDEKKLSGGQLNSIIDIINIYLIRRALCGLDSKNISRLFPALLKDTLNDCNGDYSNIVEILKKNLINKNKGNSMYMPDDSQLKELVINANMYNNHSPLRIFLDKLEHHNNPAPVDLSALSIEHLMPQMPTPEWYDALQVNEDIYQRNLNRLGNLTFATKIDNSIMKNKVWEYKNKVLKGTSHIKINEELLQIPQWKISNINERTEYLIDRINELFPYTTASADVIDKKEIYIYNNNVIATGFLYTDNGSVEIDAGSMLHAFDNADNYPEIEDIRKELIEDGIVTETEQGLCFVKQYIFYPKQSNSTALSQSASVILHGSRNGWEYWVSSNEKPLSEDEDLRKKFSK